MLPPPGFEKAMCIYPAYLNKRKTVAEGRRIPKEKCCDNPLNSEIRAVCDALGLKAISEDGKWYPRELFKSDATYRGRVKIIMKNPDGSAATAYPHKKALLAHIAEMIPKLKSRTQKAGGSVGGSATAGGGGPAQATKGGNKKKKNKRR